MPKNVVSTTVKINPKYSRAERTAIASDMIDHLRERTNKGLGKNEVPWKGKAGKYSDAYINSLAGKIGGKKKSSKVNIKLTGNTLSSIELLSNKPGEITLGIKRSDADWNKAKGNILGTYGQSKPIKGKARNFLEVGRKDKSKVLSNFPIKDRKESLKQAALVLKAIKEAEKNGA